MTARLGIWKASIKLIEKYPLGVGHDLFTYEILPYQINTKTKPSEKTVFDNPHNTFLLMATEQGIFFALVISFFIFYLLFLFLKKFKKENKEDILTACLLLSSLIEFFFQFPTDNAFSILILLLSFSLITVRAINLEASLLPKKIILIPLIYLFFYVASFYKKVYADYIYAKYTDISLMNKACSMYPNNSDLCIDTALAHIESNEYEKANKIINQQLNASPHNFLALNAKAILSFNLGDIQTTCSTLKKYDSIFEFKSTQHKYIKENCAN